MKTKSLLDVMLIYLDVESPVSDGAWESYFAVFSRIF